MKLVFNYDRKTLFGSRAFTSDETYWVTENMIKVAFSAFKKEYNSTIWFMPEATLDNDKSGSYTIAWENMNEYEEGIVTVTYSKSYYNIEEPKKMTFNKARNLIKSFLVKEEEA